VARKAKGGFIFFDITLLAVRAAFETPTGVARVELAYAQELLRRYPNRVRFVVALSNLVRIVPTAAVRPYLEAIELAWRAPSSTRNNHAVAKVAKFLGVPPTALWSGHSTRNEFNLSKALLSAKLFFEAGLRSLSPSNLDAYSNTETPNIFLHVSGSNIGNAWIHDWLERSPSVHGVFMLHDIIPLTHPEYCPANVADRHHRYLKRLSKVAKVIVANSSDTADTLHAFSEETGLVIPRTTVAPLGVGGVFASQAQDLSGAPPYFVYASTIEPRKNHLMLLQIWTRLVQQLGDAAPRLILVGRRGWENENVLDLLERSTLTRQHVLECSNLCDEALATLLRNARAALMPSHVEGFGLPVAEALMVGAPVICSPLAPFREVAGDIPEYIDPLAGPRWHRMIAEYAKPDGSRRAAQLKRRRGLQPLTWARHFETVCPVLDELTSHESPNLPVRAPRFEAPHLKAALEVAPV
jgi:glycosyltransferase involved in cell wall biosynthesis